MGINCRSRVGANLNSWELLYGKGLPLPSVSLTHPGLLISSEPACPDGHSYSHTLLVWS